MSLAKETDGRADGGAVTVAVIGGGRWARALAGTLAQNQLKRPGRIARVLHHRPAHRTPEIAAADDAPTGPPETARPEPAGLTAVELDGLGEADLILLAIPSQSVRSVLRAAAPHLHGAQMLVHAVGSLAPAEGTGAGAGGPRALISQVAREETPIRRIGALAGPALAQDLEEWNPAALICGSRYDEVNETVLRALVSPSLRLYTTHDLVGVEVARAMVSVVALASGVAHALDLGTPARAVLITRGAAEMARLGVALGASERTFFGLAGVGEMVVATERRDSADFELGRRLGSGQKLDEALREVARVCDGPTMVAEASRMAAQHGLRMPIVSALNRWLLGERDTRKALMGLFASENHEE